MIYYVISCIDKTKYEKYLKPSIESFVNIENRLILMEGKGNIFQKYNHAIDPLKKNLTKDDVVIFLHDDVTILDKNFEEKIKLFFKYKSNIGVAGVIGTTQFPEEGGWWHSDRRVYGRGKILQSHPKKENYWMIDREGMFDNLVAVDGCMLCFSYNFLKDYSFDEKTFKNFNFYDVDSCFECLKSGFDVGIIDVSIQHESEGGLSPSWNLERKLFLAKWKEIIEFPVNKGSFHKYNKMKEKNDIQM